MYIQDANVVLNGMLKVFYFLCKVSVQGIFN